MSTIHHTHFQPLPETLVQPRPLADPRQPASRGQPQPLLSMVPRAAIESEAGLRENVSTQSKSLPRRQQAAQRGPSPGPRQHRPRGRVNSEAARSNSPLDEHNEDGNSLQQSGLLKETLDILREDTGRRGQREVFEMLADELKPIEQWRLLDDALEQLENAPLSNYKKKVLRETLQEMMADIVVRDSSVREVLQDKVKATLDSAIDGAVPKSARELRFLITDKGSVDEPLSPLTMLKAIIRHLGMNRCEKAVSTLCSQMLSGL